ncbi:hypothetical protein CAPTEDRAFT_196759 [Capitella teleta]|uniref:Uncharacterized protein n=1 Tax=Capitella teleta TaxID=283909 RepID=R7V3B6_CAPTE|nr:hypothetical protein CAPTEDRAFT_196759 [Capitella teleta]|eukprot:ELU12977.1 hypothetical protein CAPTEDRAFT_196759 [Capitella teleta]
MWESMFIRIESNLLPQPIIIGSIYRLPVSVANHQLCFMRFNVKNLNFNNKYITIKNRLHNSHELFKTDLLNMNILQQIDYNSDTYPSHNYTITHNAITRNTQYKKRNSNANKFFPPVQQEIDCVHAAVKALVLLLKQAQKVKKPARKMRVRLNPARDEFEMIVSAIVHEPPSISQPGFSEHTAPSKQLADLLETVAEFIDTTQDKNATRWEKKKLGADAACQENRSAILASVLSSHSCEMSFLWCKSCEDHNCSHHDMPLQVFNVAHDKQSLRPYFTCHLSQQSGTIEMADHSARSENFRTNTEED